MSVSTCTATASLSDDELIAATRCGDELAFAELYDRYRAGVRSLAVRMTRDQERADDITQEVFIAALRRLRSTDDPIVFRPWIFQIARNACIDEHRRSRRTHEVPLEDEEVYDWLNGLGGSLSPPAVLERTQQLENLRSAFRGLSEPHHRVIVLREFEGRSYNEIARKLGISRGIVESTLFRARRRLGEEYEELSSGRRCAQVQTLAQPSRTARRLGLRERRTVSRHLEHCAACRRQLAIAGVDPSQWVAPGPRRAAGLLPVPLAGLMRWLRRGGSSALRAGRSAHQSLALAGSRLGESAQSLSAAGASRLAAAAVVAAAVGGGVVVESGSGTAHRRASGFAAIASSHGIARDAWETKAARAEPAYGHAAAASAAEGVRSREISLNTSHASGAAGAPSGQIAPNGQIPSVGGTPAGSRSGRLGSHVLVPARPVRGASAPGVARPIVSLASSASLKRGLGSLTKVGSETKAALTHESLGPGGSKSGSIRAGKR